VTVDPIAAASAFFRAVRGLCRYIDRDRQVTQWRMHDLLNRGAPTGSGVEPLVGVRGKAPQILENQ
jgi:hypothetical protein